MQSRGGGRRRGPKAAGVALAVEVAGVAAGVAWWACGSPRLISGRPGGGSAQTPTGSTRLRVGHRGRRNPRQGTNTRSYRGIV